MSTVKGRVGVVPTSVGEGVYTVPVMQGNVTWGLTSYRCPFGCGRLLKTPLSHHRWGRTIAMLAERSTEKLMVVDPLPPDMKVYSCRQCRVRFATTEDGIQLYATTREG